MYRACWLVIVFVPCAVGHGYLAFPPARNSMWREGFDTPKNYNDMGLNCGGFYNQWTVNGGECGMCGDPVEAAEPRDHEAGGWFAPVTRPISKCYNTIDHVIDITVRVTAYHKGYFEFRLCVNNDMTLDPGDDCIEDGYLLNVAGMPDVTRYDINYDKREFYHFQLDMPQGVVCTQCILQWKYNAGNNWGCDEEGCGMGVGPQEQFINCADIAILPDCGNIPVTTDSVTSNTDSTGSVTPDGSTSGPVTGAPTAVPARHCQAVGIWTGLAYMDGWCTFNCLHPTINYCPATHCHCDGDQTVRVW
ncbi:uncharacterized protein LOC123528343 [Mercenaria mercenaria]|uniref:uncharacterized protein LOC123528343 n=1 Tax=Mercenaria mercenaria TaxID=6596 RepID=UPI00234E7538|nr:uncharacterized protein LOC123528343 [Mercenaria mercenaria]